MRLLEELWNTVSIPTLFINPGNSSKKWQFLNSVKVWLQIRGGIIVSYQKLNNMVICTAESSNIYSSTWPFDWITVLVPEQMHNSRMELLTEVCSTSQHCELCERMFQDFLLVPFSVGDSCTCKYSWIYCRCCLQVTWMMSMKSCYYQSRETGWPSLNGLIFSHNV